MNIPQMEKAFTVAQYTQSIQQYSLGVYRVDVSELSQSQLQYQVHKNESSYCQRQPETV